MKDCGQEKARLERAVTDDQMLRIAVGGALMGAMPLIKVWISRLFQKAFPSWGKGRTERWRQVAYRLGQRVGKVRAAR